MVYIRTEKNKYDIDVVIDVSDNSEFIKATNLNWIEYTGEQVVENGNYYYQGKIISINSPDYSIIENIIFEYEEPLREERDKDLLTPEDNLQNDISVEEEVVVKEEKPQELPQTSPPLTEEELEDLRKLPPPEVFTYNEVESTQENLELFVQNLSNIEKTISAYDAENYTFSDHEVTFTPPIEYSDGFVQERALIPFSITLEQQIQHLKDQREQLILLVDRIKKDLQITD